MSKKSWITPFVALLALSACDSMLTETPESFITPENFYQTVADADAAVTTVYEPLLGGNGLGRALYWALELPADIARVGVEEENPNIVVLGALGYDASTPDFAASWQALYTTVTRANIVIERVDESEIPAETKAAITGEAQFLRALAYFYLARLWGDVPLVRTTDEQLTDPDRAPREEVLQQVLADAQQAVSTLPVTRTGAQLGRATRGAAHALLADVHRWRGEWQQAADAAREVIDSGLYGLVADYLDAFLPGSEQRSEEIFALQYSTTSGTPSSSLVSWTYPRILGPSEVGGWSTIEPNLSHYDSYAEGDYRRQVTYRTEGADINGTVREFAYPSVYKWRPSAVPGPQDMNTPIYRYAEVLLIYAEALNELGQTAEAVESVNAVRARARNGTVNEDRAEPADLPALGQAALREAILDERRWELAHEAKRWLDLIQLETDDFVARFADNPYVSNVQTRAMLWPVPQRERDLNPNLTQNEGY